MCLVLLTPPRAGAPLLAPTHLRADTLVVPPDSTCAERDAVLGLMCGVFARRWRPPMAGYGLATSTGEQYVISLCAH